MKRRPIWVMVMLVAIIDGKKNVWGLENRGGVRIFFSGEALRLCYFKQGAVTKKFGNGCPRDRDRHMLSIREARNIDRYRCSRRLAVVTMELLNGIVLLRTRYFFEKINCCLIKKLVNA